MAEFIASLHWQIYVWIADASKANVGITFVSFSTMLLSYLLICFVYYHLEKQRFPTFERLNATFNDLFYSLLIVVIAFAMSNISFASIDTPFTGANITSVHYSRTLVDFCGLLALYNQQYRREEVRVQAENMAINNILQMQYEQYQSPSQITEQIQRA